MTISVVMTTYNGERYLKEQLESIIPYLEDGDELIISDDGSVDATLDILSSYESENVKIFSGPQKGVVKNFESALYRASGDILMFADQDDIWLPEKLPFVRNFFKKNTDVQMLLHDMFMASNDEIQNNDYSRRSFKERRRKHGVLNNVIHNGYYGCCMSFTREFKNNFLPIGEKVNAYDQWIGLIAEYYNTAVFVDKPMIIHRCHGNNLGRNLKFIEKIRFRLQLLYSFVDYIKRKK